MIFARTLNHSYKEVKVLCFSLFLFFPPNIFMLCPFSKAYPRMTVADHVHSCNNGSAEGRWYFGVTVSLNRSGALSQNVTTHFLNVLVFLYPEKKEWHQFFSFFNYTFVH